MNLEKGPNRKRLPGYHAYTQDRQVANLADSGFSRAGREGGRRMLKGMPLELAAF